MTLVPITPQIPGPLATAAYERKLVGVLAASLNALDLRLTGKVSPNIRPTPQNWDEWLESELYLSDGYSRVVYAPFGNSPMTYELILSSHSRDAVHRMWDRARAERAAVEAAFEALLNLEMTS